MAANIQDVIMLVGDSLTQQGWGKGGFAQLLAGMHLTNIWYELESEAASYRNVRSEARCYQSWPRGLPNGLGNSNLRAGEIRCCHFINRAECICRSLPNNMNNITFRRSSYSQFGTAAMTLHLLPAHSTSR